MRLVQKVVGVFKADLVQVKVQLGAVKCLPECGRSIVERPSHTGTLAALPCIKNSSFHAWGLHSSNNSSISSRTLRILSSRGALDPQKNSPFSTSPCTAAINAWVMQ